MRHHRINLQQIEYFLAVARYLNFTEAAKSLYISQPALSKQIAVLENAIRFQLLERTRRSVRLTPAGTVLFQELETIPHQIETAVDKARRSILGENSLLTIGCLEAMGTPFLPALIKDFRQKYEGIRLIFERHSFKPLREKFFRGELDVIFTLEVEVKDTPDIVWVPFFKANPYIFMAASHPLAGRERLKLEDLRDEGFVMISREESPRVFDSSIALCRAHGFAPNIIKQMPNVESVLLSVESGVGVTLLDTSVRMIHADTFDGFPVLSESLEVGMAYSKTTLNHAVAVFANHFRGKALLPQSGVGQ
ncbi:MAG: LysR family transcriptional regulator [Clostridiaceae bacterium]|nr:LysR family transcriptional regulator [Clostridiaceae bacterium]